MVNGVVKVEGEPCLVTVEESDGGERVKGVSKTSGWYRSRGNGLVSQPH